MSDLEAHAPRLIAQLLEYGFAPVPPAPLPPEWQHVYEAVRDVRGDSKFLYYCAAPFSAI